MGIRTSSFYVDTSVLIWTVTDHVIIGPDCKTGPSLYCPLQVLTQSTTQFIHGVGPVLLSDSATGLSHWPYSVALFAA